jgi:hypothetical protein
LILNLQTGLVSPQYNWQYNDLFETTTGIQARSIPTSLWQYKAGLSSENPELTEEEQAYEDLWDEQSYEDYYSSNEGEEAASDSEEEAMVDEGENHQGIYITRSGRKSKPTERLQYNAQSCLLNWDEHEDQEA